MRELRKMQYSHESGKTYRTPITNFVHQISNYMCQTFEICKPTF